MSEPIFLTTKQAVDLMGIGRAELMRIFRRYGLEPVRLGAGRGRGLRWKRSAIIKIADTLDAEAQKKKPCVTPCQHLLLGRDIKGLFSELSTPLQ